MRKGRPGAASLASFAIELAMAARRQTLGREPHSWNIENKGSEAIFDPVTSADRAAENSMRELIMRRFPEHDIVGEEFGAKRTGGPFAWSLDPIDGTRSYICGLPNWTTLIAFLEEGEPIIGVVDAPTLDEVYLGAEGEAALIRKGERSLISTSGCTCIDEARFSTTDPFHFGAGAELLQPILRAVRVTRYALDGYAYARLAAGSIDLVIEAGLKPHDYYPLIPLIRAAGGHIGNWAGGNEFASGNVIAAASTKLYEEAVARLAWA